MLNLRIRAVEWNIADRYCECVADEVRLSPLSDELIEVRDPNFTTVIVQELQRN